MGITKFIADMDLDIVDLSDDESTEKTGVEPKDGTVAINSGNETKTNKEDSEIKMLNENESGINWNLLEMESDNEEDENQKESQASGSSVLLLEAGFDPLVLSNRKDHLDMNNNDSMDLDMRERGDQLKGLSQNNVVCSSESRVSSENMTVELTLVSEDISIENENREGLNDNIDLDLNANENLHLSLGMEIENLKGLSENSTISDAENKENFAEKRIGLVLGSTDDKKMEDENMQALDKNLCLDADKVQKGGLYLEKPRDLDVVIVSSADTTLEKRDKSEKLKLQIISESGDKEPRIDYMDGVNETSDSGTCAINRMFLGSGEVDDHLKDSKVSSVVSCLEIKDSSEKLDRVTILLKKDKEMDNEIEGAIANVDIVLKEGVNSEVLIKDGEAVFAENKDKGEEVHHEKLNLEVVVGNDTAVTGDSEVNDFQLLVYTGVQETIARKLVVINKGQTEIIEPSFDETNTDFGSKFEPSNNVSLITSNNEIETMYPGSPLSSILDSKSPRRRGRPRKVKGKINDPSADLAMVVYNSGENSNSRGKRKRKGSKYLSHPYTNVESSLKRPKIDLVTNGETKKAKEGNEIKTGKTDMYPQQVVADLISTAQGPLNPQTNLTVAARGFLTSFRDAVCSKVNVKTSQEVCSLTIGATVNVPDSDLNRDHHVLLDARCKLDGIILSLNGSSLEHKESLVGDVRGLLDKIKLILTDDFRTLGSNIGNRVLQQKIINLE